MSRLPEQEGAGQYQNAPAGAFERDGVGRPVGIRAEQPAVFLQPPVERLLRDGVRLALLAGEVRKRGIGAVGVEVEFFTRHPADLVTAPPVGDTHFTQPGSGLPPLPTPRLRGGRATRFLAVGARDVPAPAADDRDHHLREPGHGVGGPLVLALLLGDGAKGGLAALPEVFALPPVDRADVFREPQAE